MNYDIMTPNYPSFLRYSFQFYSEIKSKLPSDSMTIQYINNIEIKKKNTD